MRTLLIGLPSSGKTTFLAALWHSVTTPSVHESLKINALAEDTEYLNQIRDTWLRVVELNHTAVGTMAFTQMNLTYVGSEQALDLTAPDLAGETLEEYLTERTWPQEFDDYIKQTDSILLFVSSDEHHPETPIKDAATILQELPDHENQVDNLATREHLEDGTEPLALEPAATPLIGPTLIAPNPSTKIPPQVKLVDLLQLVLATSGCTSPIKVGVIVSAWDLVQTNFDQPEVWLTAELPLLDQYLRSNKEILTFRVYGVSAQGGQLPDEADQLKAEVRPSDRIIVVGGNALEHDITAPLKWLLDVTLDAQVR